MRCVRCTERACWVCVTLHCNSTSTDSSGHAGACVVSGALPVATTVAAAAGGRHCKVNRTESHRNGTTQCHERCELPTIQGPAAAERQQQQRQIARTEAQLERIASTAGIKAADSVLNMTKPARSTVPQNAHQSLASLQVCNGGPLPTAAAAAKDKIAATASWTNYGPTRQVLNAVRCWRLLGQSTQQLV